jgi:hypothetical protein
MEVNLCDRFSGVTPFSIRREKAREVFTLLKRFNRYARRNKKGKKTIIRRPAGDNWF